MYTCHKRARKAFAGGATLGNGGVENERALASALEGVGVRFAPQSREQGGHFHFHVSESILQYSYGGGAATPVLGEDGADGLGEAGHLCVHLRSEVATVYGTTSNDHCS